MSIPEGCDPEMTRGNGMKTERLRVPLRGEAFPGVISPWLSVALFSPVAEYVSIPKGRDPGVARGNGTKTERLRVPLRGEAFPGVIFPRRFFPRSGIREYSGGV